MQKEFIVNEKIITIDTGAVYSGSSMLNDDEKLVRKAIGLPVTKQLVYYTNNKKPDSTVPVLEFQISAFYENWCIVQVLLQNGDTQLIHSTYLAEMQRPSFVADMARQEAEMK